MKKPRDISRRDFVTGASAAIAVSAAGTSAAAEAPRPAAPASAAISLTDLSAVEAVARMTRGEMSAELYARALVARCQATKALNAFITFDPDRVIADARERDRERRKWRSLGPLFGLPIPVKDSVNTHDYPTTAGTPALRKFRPREDAPVVAALRAAGAIVLGKTNLHELSYGWTSNNLAFGAVHNPYALKRIPGGSSGGTAAAVAAHCAPLGIAEDTEGSIRVPAALCGLAALRPTTGRYPTTACVPISSLFDQVGPHARTVEDLVLFDSIVAKDPAPLVAAELRGIRLGVVRDYWFKDLDSEVERITAHSLRRLTEAGAVLVESQLPGLQALIDQSTQQIQNHDVRLSLAHFLKEYGAGVSLEELIAQASPDIQATFKSDVMPGGKNFVAEAVYAKARDTVLPALRALFNDYFAKHRVDAIVFPATMVPAPLIGEEDTLSVNGRKISFTTAISRNIDPGSTAGLPGLVLPAGLTPAGLPVSLEFDAPAGADRRLLALGLTLERVLGRLPPPKI
jgi:Asp-tRNA(Asn)/Glu-tRNA(Gln) amidotransferase A subunit family amidase